MKNLNEKIAVVTGAGSGIGRATALALAEQGAIVVATDVQESSARKTAEDINRKGQNAHAFQLDVSDYGQMEDLAQRVEHSIGVPSLLVNNAGIAVAGLFLDTSLESWQRIMSINVMGVVHGCRAFLPSMVRSGEAGHVVNISSAAGYTAAQKMSAYCTTKFGVIGFSESLRAEMASHGIGVTAICPGIINTNIVKAGVFEIPGEDMEAKKASIDKFYEKRNYTPERAAAAIVKAIRRNRAIAPVTPEAWVFYYAKRWVPWAVRWSARFDLM